jgi:uncharacterized protein
MTIRPVSPTIRCLLASAITLQAACFSLGRNPPPLQHYLLGENRPAVSGTQLRDSASLRVGIRRIQLESYLASPFLVIRHGEHEITFSEFHRWGEDLEAGISRAVSAALAARPPFPHIDVAPWPRGAEHRFLIQLHVDRFEGSVPGVPSAREGEARVRATWRIIHQTDGTVVRDGVTDFHQGGWKVGDYAGLVVMLASGLDALAADVAGALATLVDTR